jgi:predicted permease
MMWSDLLFRFRALVHRRVMERELNEEIQFHLEHQIGKYENSGMRREAAVREARLDFGGLDQVKEECRQARGIHILESFGQDLRYGVRSLRHKPALTLVALVTLALATGTISTVFVLANTFFFRYLPVDRPAQLVAVTPTRRHGTVLGYISYRDYLQFRDHNKTLKGLAAHYPTAPLFVSANKNAREINGAVVTANFFPLLGIKPALGRFFRPDEDSVPDRDPVAVLGYDLWRNWFSGSPKALGSNIRINGVSFTVIGVAPASFHGMSAMPTGLYIPTMMLHVGYQYCDVLGDADCTILSMVGRLAPGRRTEDARAEMATLVPYRWRYAAEGDNSGIIALPERGSDRDKDDSTIRFMTILFLVAGVLLLVCCANLAGLLISRGEARAHELAVRASLGAGRLRLIRQLMTEAGLLALVGGALGIVVSSCLTKALGSMFYSIDDEGHPLWYDFTPDPGIVLTVAAISLAAAVLFGLIPAIKSSRLAVAESLKAHAPTVSASRQLGQWLVGTQAALAVALATIAGLLIANARTLVAGLDFEPSHVALMRLRPGLVKYSPDRAQRFLHTAIQRLELVPEVESASLIGSGTVLNGSTADVALLQSSDPKSQAIHSGYIDVGPRYFATLRTPVLSGREFDARDDVNAPRVAIVNQTLATRFWPSGGTIGSTILVNGMSLQIVGIVKDVPLQSRGANSKPYIYVPYWQNAKTLEARLRVRGNPTAMLPRLVREVNRVDPDVPIAETITLPVQLDGMFRPLRVGATFLGYVAGLSVLLSAVGLYGVLAFRVSRRKKEIGIRIALGADPFGVRTMIIKEGMAVVLFGSCAGIGLALGGIRLVRSLLFQSAPGDWLFYGAALSLVACIGLLACSFPAHRAARTAPLDALREE